MIESKFGAQACRELLEIYYLNRSFDRGEKLIFDKVDGMDVYNIAAPFEDEGDMVIAGRVEDRDSEYSNTIFFINCDGVWVPRKNTIVFRLQDPFHTRINGELIFGGVEVLPDYGNHDRLRWRTIFYRGKCINKLRYFAAGPEHMKDIRLIQLKDHRIGVFTRPMGGAMGRGKIGFTIIDSLDELNADVILGASIIKGQFKDDEWGGANELHILKNGLIGVLGHIACFDKKMNRHYYSIAFSVNTVSNEVSPIKIIATRSDFIPGDAKRPDLVDVIFSGGLVRKRDGLAELYAGVSDAEAHRLIIPDPFDEYES